MICGKCIHNATILNHNVPTYSLSVYVLNKTQSTDRDKPECFYEKVNYCILKIYNVFNVVPKYSNFNDQELAALLKQGDQFAFAEIYNRYKFVLHTHAVNKLRDREEAKDIIQEVFTYLWSKRERVQFTENLSGYLYGAVRHAILNKFTRKQVQERYFDSIKAFAAQESVITDHRIRENQLREQIEKEISLLPLKMRAVFEMSRKEYLSHQEIALKLKISEQTVSKQITNALKILKVKLGVLICLLLVASISLFIKFNFF